MPRPRPLAPSTANRRCGHRAAQAHQRLVGAGVDRHPSRGHLLTGGVEGNGGQRCLVRIDPDGDHDVRRPFTAGGGNCRGGQPDSKKSLSTPLSSHTTAGRRPAVARS